MDTSSVGGALYAYYSTVNIENATIANNHAERTSASAGGGALYLAYSDLTCRKCLFYDNVVANNLGSAIFVTGGGNLTLIQSTVGAHDGSAIYAVAPTTVSASNTILLGTYAASGSTYGTFSYTNRVGGGILTGEGNIDSDPNFVNVITNILHKSPFEGFNLIAILLIKGTNPTKNNTLIMLKVV